MATVLDKELKRQITVDGADYTVALTPDGVRLTGKGKRKPEIELRWLDLLSGEAAMAAALNASVSMAPRAVSKARSAPTPTPTPTTAPAPAPAQNGKPARRKRQP